MSLSEKLAAGQNGILLYGLTPPKIGQPDEKLREIAGRQLTRIEKLRPHLDGLVLYDLQSEEERTSVERPFPFVETLDPDHYRRAYLGGLDLPAIIYRCVGKYSADELRSWLQTAAAENANPATQTGETATVFVGAASRTQQTRLSMSAAYRLRQDDPSATQLALGGVAIPERHTGRADEHERLLSKTRSGCSFFITQAVYNIEASRNLLSDYYYLCERERTAPRPILFTFTPCGSQKTLEFMQWLGVHIPRWLENDLRHSGNILEASYKHCVRAARELIEYARNKGIPVGCNIESVAVRKAEIEASLELVAEIAGLFKES